MRGSVRESYLSSMLHTHNPRHISLPRHSIKTTYGHEIPLTFHVQRLSDISSNLLRNFSSAGLQWWLS